MSFRRKIAAFVAATIALVGVVGAFAADTGNDEPHIYSLISVDAVNQDGSRIEGAELQLLKADGTEFTSWTSGDTAQTIQNVPSGNYTIHEVKAPKNYKKAADVNIVLESNGKSKVAYQIEHEATVTYDIQISKICKEESTRGTAYIKGAVMQLLTENGDVVDEWTSTLSPHVIEGVEFGKYIIHEVSAPVGYTRAKDTEIILDQNGKSKTAFDIDDVRTAIILYKRNAETDELLAGAKFEIIDKDNNVVGTIISAADQMEASDGEGNPPMPTVSAVYHLPFGEYTVHEAEAPNGFEKAKDVKVVISEENPQPVVTVYDERIGLYENFKFRKIDAGTNEAIEGAVLELYKYASNGVDKELIDSWTTTKEFKDIKLKAGKYVLSEKKAPAGYLIAEPMEFNVDAITAETTTGDEAKHFEMKDDYIKVDVEKVDGDKKFVKGAKLELKSKDGKTVYTWESGDEAYRINRIPAGIYTLSELEAPKGYEKAESKTIEVLETGKIQTFELVNKKTTVYEVTISKQDMANSKELEGAKLVIKNKDGKTVEEWTSGKEARVIKTLEPGDYTLEEISAPSGYVKAEKISFTVGKNGKVETSVTMKDDVTRVEIHKQNKETEKELKGAKLELMGPDGKTVEEWTSDGSAKVFKGLKHGKYTLKEVEAPEGFKKADDITFEVTDEPKTIKVYMYDEKDGKIVKEEKDKTTKEKEKVEKENKKEKVQTSDDNNVMPYILLALALVLAGGVAIKVKSKNDNDSNDNENK